MFGIFKKKQSTPQPSAPLYFKDGDAAFAFACTISNPVLAVGDMIPAIVVSLSNPTGKGTIAQLTFVSPEGGRAAFAPVADSIKELKAGDLVAFKIFEINDDLPSVTGILGAVVAKLSPEFMPGKGWAISREAPV